MKKLLLILLCLPMIGFGQLQFKLDSIVWQDPDPASNDFMKNIYTYNLQEKCIESLWLTNSMKYKFKNIHNSNNQIEEIEVYFWDSNNSQWIFNQKQLFVYNINNMLEEHESMNYNPTTLQWTQNQKEVYYFNSSNQVIKQEYYDWTGTNYVMYSVKEYTYFSGYIQSLNTVDNNGIWEPWTLAKSFALNGNTVIDSSFSYQNGNWIYSGYSEYFYNTNLMSETAFYIGPPYDIKFTHIYQNQITQSKSYDENGSLTDNSTAYYSSFSGTSSFFENQTTTKELLKVTDLLGRETEQANQPLFYIYDDGTVEKRIVIE
jgi:hypothetical protein